MSYEIDFLPVGKSSGDAILLRYGTPLSGFTVHLIDGGYSDTSQRIIDHIKNFYSGAPIEHMVLSHADDDHATGLIEVLDKHEVHNLWMNRPWLFARDVVEHFHANYTVEGLAKKMRELHPYLVELEAIATRRNIPIRDAFQGTKIGLFTVLAPSRDRYISLIPLLDKTPTNYSTAQPQAPFGLIADAFKAAVKWVKESWQFETLRDDLETSASNETSLVQWANIDGHSILLTSDVGPKGLEEAARHAHVGGFLYSPKFVQMPHHGSRHNVSKTTLNWWLGEPVADNTIKRGVAFCSVGDGKRAEDYPRRIVTNAFLRRGYPVHVTRGTGKRQHYGMGNRLNWQASESLAFSYDVED